MFKTTNSIIQGIKTYSIKSILFNVFSIISSDYVIVSFQKCGKTWLRMMLARAISLKYNIKKIKLDLQLMTLFHPKAPNILISHAGSTKDNNKVDFVRLFKKKKIVFLMRDPRDIVVSLFHGSRTRDKVYSGNDMSTFIHDKNSGFEKIINFMNLWAKEIKKRPKDFIIVKYEDMKKDAKKQLRRIFDFFKIKMPDEIIEEAVNYGSFDNMRKMEMANKVNDYRMKSGNKNDPNSFRTRKGKVGGFKEEVTKEDVNYMNKEMKERLDPFFGYSVK